MSADAPGCSTHWPAAATVMQTEDNNPVLAVQAAVLRCIVAAELFRLTGELPAYVTHQEDPPCPTP